MFTIDIISDPRVPFSGARWLLHEVAASIRTDLVHNHIRAITHDPPAFGSSLSDAQVVDEQLRYYTADRVRRGFVAFAESWRSQLGPTEIRLPLRLHRADREFFDIMARHGAVALLGGAPSREPPLELRSARFTRALDSISAGTIDAADLRTYVDELLNVADSWSASDLALAYVKHFASVPATLADVLGLALSMQGLTGIAEKLYSLWARAGGVHGARAKYSLAMLYARHHPLAFLDTPHAAELMESAWLDLEQEECTDQVEYERIFNRNGLALMKFRDGEFDQAAALLSDGIERILRTPFAGTVHHTVLLNNLGRVEAARDRWEHAESALRAAIELDCRFAEYWQDLAAFLEERGRLDESLEAVDRAIDCDSVIPSTHALRGFVLHRLGRAEEAIDSYGRAEELAPGTAALNLMRLHSEVGNFTEVRRLAGEVPQLLWPLEARAEVAVLLLEAELNLGVKTDAAGELERLSDLFPHSPIVAENLAAVRAR